MSAARMHFTGDSLALRGDDIRPSSSIFGAWRIVHPIIRAALETAVIVLSPAEAELAGWTFESV